MSETLEHLSVGGDQVSAFRMQRHHLHVRAARDRLPAVVGDTCGVQAQVTVMARIALWARLEGLTIDDVGRALHPKRTIAKTWSLRGALHLHRSSELLEVLGGLMATRLLLHRRWIHRAGLIDFVAGGGTYAMPLILELPRRYEPRSSGRCNR